MLKITSGIKDTKTLNKIHSILKESLPIELNKCSIHIIEYLKELPKIPFYSELLCKTSTLYCQTNIFTFNEYNYYSIVNNYEYQTTIKYKKINNMFTWLIKTII
jgi:hypothetical protein